MKQDVMQRSPAQRAEPLRAGRLPRWLAVGFWISVVIAIAAVVRRLIALAHPSSAGPPQMVATDADFSSHAVLTMVHIVPAAIFVILAVIVLLRDKRSVWAERLFFPFGAITGLTAYTMSVYAIGGWTEVSAILVMDTWFLYSLGRAYWLRKLRDAERQRTWMTRSVGVLLGIATTRPVIGVFFATSRITHLTPKQFFGIAFWIGFSINAIVTELWLHSKRRAQLREAATGA